MDILWVEDDNNILDTTIFESKYFNSYLSDEEIKGLEKLRNENFKKIKKYLKNVKNKIFLASNLKECMEIIKNHETTFHKIIIDIDFPFNDDDLYEILKDSFLEKIDENYNHFIEEISKNEYAGIIFNHIIASKYKNEYHWNKNDIYNNIVFLSGNDIKITDFEEKLIKLYGMAFRYDSDASFIRFFSKNNDKDMKNFITWLTEDKYTIILDKYTNKQALKMFLELQKNRISKNPTIISGNLLHLRQLLESYIIKKILIEITEELELKMEDNKFKKAFFPKLKKFDLKKEYDFKEIKNYILMKADSVNMKNAINYIPKEFKEAKGKEITNLMLNYPWKILSKLIHNDGSLTSDGENFIKDTDRAINTINIIYYQLKEIILWFGQVMEKLEKKEKTLTN